MAFLLSETSCRDEKTQKVAFSFQVFKNFTIPMSLGPTGSTI